MTEDVIGLMASRRTLVLTEADVEQLLGMSDCIERQKQAFREVSSGLAGSPARLRLQVSERVAGTAMPGHASSGSVLGCKFVTRALDNRARGLPTLMSTLLVMDSATGFPLACMASTHLTNARTAASVAVAVQRLRRPGATSVGLYGTGVVARLVLDALSYVLNPEHVTVFSPSADHRTTFAREASRRFGWSVTPASDAAEPASADIVVAATTSEVPVLTAEWLRPGATVASVATRPDIMELPVEAVVGNKLIVDSREAALAESGELRLGIARGVLGPHAIHAELGEILLGLRPGRETDDERVVFKSAGLAVQDLITAKGLIPQALARGLGTVIPMCAAPPPGADPHP